MRRPERVSWKDTNMALVGSDLDRKIKEAASRNEPQWVGAGDGVMLRVWRIEQFVVKPWPNRKYGQVRGACCPPRRAWEESVHVHQELAATLTWCVSSQHHTKNAFFSHPSSHILFLSVPHGRFLRGSQHIQARSNQAQTCA
jgi:hypothetical protein